MRLHRIRFRGIKTAFPQETHVDFDSLGPGLIALVGDNGSGKTSLMSAPCVGLYKTFPSRPGFYENFTGSDAFIEAHYKHGRDLYEVRLLVNAEKRKTEGYVMENGKAITDGKAAAFSETIDRLFGTVDLFLASVFAAQDKSGNFLKMAKAQRKELFVELLGVGRLEEYHTAAKSKRDAADLECGRFIDETERLQEDIDKIANAREDLEIRIDKQDDRKLAVEATRAAEVKAIEERTASLGAQAEIDNARELESAAAVTVEDSREEIESIENALGGERERFATSGSELERILKTYGARRDTLSIEHKAAQNAFNAKINEAKKLAARLPFIG